MKRIIFIIASIFLLAGLYTSYAVHKTIPSESVVPLPGPYAETVYRYITVEDQYKDYKCIVFDQRREADGERFPHRY